MFTGRVIRGKQYGRQLGYPTANLSTPAADTGLDSGVYAARAVYDGTSYNAALMVSHEVPYVEVYLIDFAGDLYDQELSVHTIQKVSNLVACNDEEELKAKIAADMELIHAVFDK